MSEGYKLGLSKIQKTGALCDLRARFAETKLKPQHFTHNSHNLSLLTKKHQIFWAENADGHKKGFFKKS